MPKEKAALLQDQGVIRIKTGNYAEQRASKIRDSVMGWDFIVEDRYIQANRAAIEAEIERQVADFEAGWPALKTLKFGSYEAYMNCYLEDEGYYEIRY